MTKLLLKNGLLIDRSENLLRSKKDVLVVDNKIEKIADEINDNEAQVIDCDGLYVAPGFIDMHAHMMPTAKTLCLIPDDIGVKQGVTTICDAGTAGPENIEFFIDEVIKKSRTRVFSNMHFAKQGLVITPEADDESKYDIDLAERKYKEHKQYISAIKARASNSTVGKLGIKPIKDAKTLGTRIGLPLFVHIGRPLPYLEEVLDVLGEGDVITHTYHGKEINWILDNGKVKEKVWEARKKGIIFDVGHGSESFSFKTAKIAFAEGFIPDTISTDLHNRNINGPVYSLSVTMDKMMALGLSLEQVIEMVTANPAKYFKFSVPIGKLKEGYMGDFTIFNIEQGKYNYVDAEGNELTGTTKIVPQYTIVNGKVEMSK